MFEKIVFLTVVRTVTKEGRLMSLYAACSGYHLHDSGRMFSPNYPENYDNYLDCNWVVHAEDGSPVKIDLNVDGIESNDYLQVCLIINYTN